MIHEERIKALNDRQVRRGRNVLYWMQASQRAQYNHALEFAIRKANELDLPLLVFFGITDDFPEGRVRGCYDKGLRRKFDADGYVAKIERMMVKDQQ